MQYQLSATEARVIGCLLEKQVTTPEQYPLSVNAVTMACMNWLNAITCARSAVSVTA